jgi:hypothetical protein
VSEASLGLESHMFHRILVNPSFDELNNMIKTCFNPSRPATRSLSQGLPLALGVNNEAF